MTAFTSFFVRSECWSVIFWINSDFVIIFDMLSCPGFRLSTIVGTRTEKSNKTRELHSFVSISRLGRLLLHPQKRIGRVVRTCESGSPGPLRGWVFEPIRGPRKRNPEWASL